MQTMNQNRITFCSDRSNCLNCEFFFECDVIPASEFLRLCKCKIAAVYGDFVGGPEDEKTLS